MNECLQREINGAKGANVCEYEFDTVFIWPWYWIQLESEIISSKARNMCESTRVKERKWLLETERS